MKKLIVLFLTTLAFSNVLFSQIDSLQKQINEQVWKPFVSSFNNNDNEGFKKVHSKEMIRVIQDSKQIMGVDEYLRPVPGSIRLKRGDWKRNIELRFIQRIAASGKAFEVGYFKSTSTNVSTGETRTGYGKFHVLLRKEDRIWKILMDADAREKTDESIFQTGAAIE